MLEISKYKTFAYRNSSNLTNFCVSEHSFFLLCINSEEQNKKTEILGEIHLYSKNKPQARKYYLDIQPQCIFIAQDILFIYSDNKIFYLDDQIRYLSDVGPLAFNFMKDDNLFSVNESVIKIFRLVDINGNKIAMETREHEIDNHGLCSSGFQTENFLFLGFETGITCAINMNDFGNITSLLPIKVLDDIKEPVISMYYSKGCLYFSSLDHVYRHNTEDTGKQHLKLSIKIIKIFGFKDILIFQQEQRILFYSTELEYLDCTIFQLAIKKIEVVKNRLIIGFDIGLLVDYALDSIIKDINC